MSKSGRNGKDSHPNEQHPREIYVISDLHVGSSVGLWPGSHPIEGGGLYTCNKYQRWLYETCWQSAVERIGKSNRPILVINGDIIQGINHKDGQLIGASIADQTRAAESLLRPLVEKCSALYVIRGTEWHEGKCSEDVERLAASLGAIPDEATSQHSRWEMYVSLDGHVIHFAHHIGISSVPWYEATVPTRDAQMQQAELSRWFGVTAPNVEMFVRSHRHRYVQVQIPPRVTALVTPAWQLKTAFAHKKATSMLPEIGYVRILLRDEWLAADPMIYPLPGISVLELNR